MHLLSPWLPHICLLCLPSLTIKQGGNRDNPGKGGCWWVSYSSVRSRSCWRNVCKDPRWRSSCAGWQRTPGVSASLPPSIGITSTGHVLLFYAGCGDWTHGVTLVQQALCQLRHLPSAQIFIWSDRRVPRELDNNLNYWYTQDYWTPTCTKLGTHQSSQQNTGSCLDSSWPLLVVFDGGHLGFLNTLVETSAPQWLPIDPYQMSPVAP